MSNQVSELLNENARLREELNRERSRIQNVFSNSPAFLAILQGPEFVFDGVNERYYDLVGKREILGKPALEALPVVANQGFIELLQNVYETGEPFIGNELPLTVHRFGQPELRFVDFTYQQIRDANGNPSGIFAHGFDVTDKVRARIELETAQAATRVERHKFEAIFYESPAAMALLVGPDFVFEKANPAYLALYNREILGKPILEAMPELIGQPFFDLLTNVLTTGKPFHGKEMLARMPRKPGQPLEDFYFDFAYERILDADGKPYGVYCHAIEVTEKVMSRLALEKAKKLAERANELKSAFLANMSHEIRTPLGAMMGFADLLRDTGLSSDERSAYIDILVRNGEQLSVIINDILDLSKVEAGHLSLEYVECDPARIANEVVSLLSVKAKEKELAFEYECGASTPNTVVTDPYRLRQILINIVGNALKFTQSGKVSIRSLGVREDQSAGDQRVRDPKRMHVRFEIQDTGIGIPKNQVERVFAMFVQADGSMTRKFGGTGLGLDLSRKLARQLGGDVEIAQTEEGQGTTFVVTVLDRPEFKPVQAPLHLERVGTPTDELMADSLKGMRILIVDDASDNQKLISRYLNRYGATVDTADNGAEGYRKALMGDFDAVLMDIQMPVMDGYTATQKLREHGFVRPVIALTAHAMSEVRKKCLNVGCTDHLTKPIQQKELVATLARFRNTASARIEKAR